MILFVMLSSLELLRAQSLRETRTLDLLDQQRNVSVHVIVSVPSHVDLSMLYVFLSGAGVAATEYQWLTDIPTVAVAQVAVPPWPVYPQCGRGDGGLCTDSTYVAFVDQRSAYHKRCAADLAFAAAYLRASASHDAQSLLHGRLKGRVLLGGHSWGGGYSLQASSLLKCAAAGTAPAVLVITPFPCCSQLSLTPPPS